jgi:hypothetical protein
MFIHCAISLAIYPGIIFKLLLFTKNFSLSCLFIQLIWNFSDTLGRQLHKFIKIKNKKITFTLVYLRIYFLIIFPLHVYMVKNGYATSIFNELFLFFNIFFFALSSGYLLSDIFFMLSQCVMPEDLKGKASNILNTSLNIGFFIGTLLAYLVNYIVYLYE